MFCSYTDASWGDANYDDWKDKFRIMLLDCNACIAGMWTNKKSENRN